MFNITRNASPELRDLLKIQTTVLDTQRMSLFRCSLKAPDNLFIIFSRQEYMREELLVGWRYISGFQSFIVGRMPLCAETGEN